MKSWIFITNLNRFRMHDFLRDYGFVEFLQKNKVHEGDIVFLYITRPYKRIEYKMVVEKTDIPWYDAFDDRAYSLSDSSSLPLESELVVRLKLVDRVISSELSLDCLYEHGLRGMMQGNKIADEELTAYIESIFAKPKKQHE